MTSGSTVAIVAAAKKSGEAVKAGPIGLAIILILCIACYFLFKSMSRHMRNVRENFPVDGVAPVRPVTAGSLVAAPARSVQASAVEGDATSGSDEADTSSSPVDTSPAEPNAENADAGPDADADGVDAPAVQDSIVTD